MKVLKELEQFLVDEKELLTDLALDVANTNSEIKYKEAKSLYDIQNSRVNAIQDSIDLLKLAQKRLVKSIASSN